MKVEYQGKEYTLPDFLIVGAAKSGTTSLHNYLKDHKDIFMPDEKEPYFFSFWNENVNFNSPDKLPEAVTDLSDYADMYKNSGDKLCGDASPSYLYTHKKTIKNIKELYGNESQNLKIIIILRDPVSRAWSQFMHFRKYYKEPLEYDSAFKKETISKRMQSEWNIFYDYLGFSCYAEALEDFLSNFSKVRIYLFDDLKQDAPSLMRDLLEFLEVDPLFDTSLLEKKHNLSGKPGNAVSELIWKLMYKDNFIKKIAAAIFSKEFKKKVFSYLSPKILKKESIPPKLNSMLKPYFEPEIDRLEKVIKRDLTHWK